MPGPKQRCITGFPRRHVPPLELAASEPGRPTKMSQSWDSFRLLLPGVLLRAIVILCPAAMSLNVGIQLLASLNLCNAWRLPPVVRTCLVLIFGRLQTPTRRTGGFWVFSDRNWSQKRNKPRRQHVLVPAARGKLRPAPAQCSIVKCTRECSPTS